MLPLWRHYSSLIIKVNVLYEMIVRVISDLLLVLLLGQSRVWGGGGERDSVLLPPLYFFLERCYSSASAWVNWWREAEVLLRALCSVIAFVKNDRGAGPCRQCHLLQNAVTARRSTVTIPPLALKKSLEGKSTEGRRHVVFIL